jgi:hypothetical protein
MDGSNIMQNDQIDKKQTTPGFHKLFHFNKFQSEEQRILKRLGREWYLTNSGDEFTIGLSQYRYFLMKPTQIFSEMFNIEREILCVFSPYESFEPRTLDAFEHAANQTPNLRLESVCRVLISKDDKIEEKIVSLLKADPEQPIVIPFSYSELSQQYDDYFIRNRFRKHFYTRDLFSFLSPLKKDLYFFGRSELIQDIVNRHRSGEHTALFGLRKSGKTSIIFAIERFMVTHEGLTITIDCESPSVHMLRWNELLHVVVQTFREKHNSNFEISNSKNYTEKRAAALFERDMLGIFDGRKQPTLLIFDEIERISPKTGSSEHWREGDDFVYFWQTLRFFFQKHSHILTYMLVGTNPYCVETPMIGLHDNPLFSSIPFQYVPSFDVAKTREMIRKLGRYMGLKFDEIIFGKLTEDFGGHPFLIRQFCSIVNTLAIGDRPVTVDKALYEKAKAQFLLDAKHYVDMVIQVLREWYKDEYDMLMILANNDMSMFDALAKEGNYYTNHLIGYGLINKSNNGYSFNVESVKEYLVQKHKYEKQEVTPEKKLQEINERRISLEQNLRKIIRNQLKSKYGKKEGLQKLLSALPENRRLALASKDIDEILEPGSSPLYFLDLANIINREWEIFKNIFEMEKNKLAFMLDEINTLRKDAHSNHISDDDFSELRLYFKKLESMLENWL